MSKDEWLQLPAVCVTCKLWQLEFLGNDTKALAVRLNKLYDNKVVVAEIKVRVLSFPRFYFNFKYSARKYAN